MRKLIGKLRSVKGESFIELLFAVLIVALGCAVIATMFSVSLSLNRSAKEKDDAYYEAIAEMEQTTEPSGSLPVEIDDGSGQANGKITVETNRYGDGDIYSYRRGVGD